MQLKLGNRYTFLTNGVDLDSRTRLVEYDDRPVRYVTRVDVSGWLEGDSQGDLSDQEEELREALRSGYHDLRFLTDGGGNTAVSLFNSESLSGVRVVDGPNFPGDTGAEYATVRRFQFAVESECIIRGKENAVLAFQESLTITGTGGPVRRYRVPINAGLVRQVVSPRSVVRATQAGRAVGHTRWPTPANPLFPAYELLDQRRVARQSPKRFGRGWAEFEVQWGYEFEADVPLVGVPTLIPLTQ